MDSLTFFSGNPNPLGFSIHENKANFALYIALCLITLHYLFLTILDPIASCYLIVGYVID